MMRLEKKEGWNRQITQKSRKLKNVREVLKMVEKTKGESRLGLTLVGLNLLQKHQIRLRSFATAVVSWVVVRKRS